MGTARTSTSFLKQVEQDARKYLRPAIATAVPIIQRLPHSFKLFGIPRNVGSCYQLGCTPIYPKTPIQRQNPRTLDDKIHWRFTRDLNEDERRFIPDTFVVRLDQGFSTNIGANLDRTGVLIPEVSKQFDLRKNERHKIFNSVTPFPKIHYVDATVGAIAFEGQSNYFHWVFDALPQFHLLEKAGLKPEKLYTECQTRFQRETLQFLGYQPDQIIESSKFEFISAKHLIVPSFPGKSGYVPGWACEFLRHKFLPHKLQGNLELSDDNYRRLYLSRRGAKRRRILNEAELINALKPYGFIEIQTDQMSFLDQVRLFNNAEIVIAPHGAGLTNLVFCEPRTKVIELFSPQYVNGCYWTLCEQIGLRYHYLIGEGDRPPDYYDSRRVTDNIALDLDKLKQTLELAEIFL